MQRTDYARNFLAEAIAETRSKLEEQERRLIDYAADARIVTVPLSGGNDKTEGASQIAGQSLAGAELQAISDELAKARALTLATIAAATLATGSVVVHLADAQASSTVATTTGTTTGVTGSSNAGSSSANSSDSNSSSSNSGSTFGSVASVNSNNGGHQSSTSGS